MISRSIGAPFGGATGVLFYMCYVANCAFNGTAFVEDIVDTFLNEESQQTQKIYGLYIYHGTVNALTAPLATTMNVLGNTGEAGAFCRGGAFYPNPSRGNVARGSFLMLTCACPH